ALDRESLDEALRRCLGAEASRLGLAQSNPEPLFVRTGAAGRPVEGGLALLFGGRTGARFPGRRRRLALKLFQLVAEAPSTGDGFSYLLADSPAGGQSCRLGPSEGSSPAP